MVKMFDVIILHEYVYGEVCTYNIIVYIYETTLLSTSGFMKCRLWYIMIHDNNMLVYDEVVRI